MKVKMITRKVAVPIFQGLSQRKLNKQISNCSNEVKLEIGAGINRRPGWFCTDICFRSEFFLDMKKKWVLKKKIHYIYSEMSIASLNKGELEIFLNNCFENLVEGGVLRICTNNIENYARIYCGLINIPILDVYNRLNRIIPNSCNTPVDIIYYPIAAHSPGNLSYYYDFESIKTIVTKLGFSKIYKTETSTSDYPELRNLEKRNDSIDKLLNLVVEVVK